MTLETKNILKISSVYTGTVLGAGFASGKELVNFFVRHGLSGIFGMLISGILFSFIGLCVLKIVYENKISDYHSFSACIFGNRLGAVFEWLVCAFLLILFSAMISAGGEISHTVFNISRFKGEIILSILCFITFLFELNGFIDINTFLAPILVVGGIITGLYIFFNPVSEACESVFNISFLDSVKEFSLSESFLASAFIYVSYNLITAVTVLVSMKELILSKKVFKYGAVGGGFCVCLLGIAISMPLFSAGEKIFSAQMPILNMVLNYSLLKYIYVVILLSAVFTTALANGFSLIQNFGSKKNFIKLFLPLWGILMAQIGFSNFIEKIYPVFGVLGIFECFMIVRAATFKKKL